MSFNAAQPYATSLIISLCIHTTSILFQSLQTSTSNPSHPSLLNLTSSPTPHKGSEHLTPELAPLPVMKLTNLPQICTFLFHSPHKKIKEVSLPISRNHSPIFSAHRAVVKYKCYNPHITEHNVWHITKYSLNNNYFRIKLPIELCPSQHSKGKTINPISE